MEKSIFHVCVCVCVCVTESLCCISETNTFDVNQLLLLFHHQVLCDSCDPMDCSPPGSSVHGALQARILDWVAISVSKGSSQPRDQTRSPALQADALLSELLGNPLGMDCFYFNVTWW